MRKIIVPLATILFAAVSVSTSFANIKIFRNCTEMNKVYPGGVALPDAINTGGTTKNQPTYDKVIYLANKKLDRDKDGLACEK